MLKRCLVLLLGASLTASLAAPAFAGGWGSRYHYGFGSHYGGYHGGHVGGHYSHRGGGGDAGAALVAGLVLGGLVGWLINEDRHYYKRRDYWDEPRYRPAPPPYRDYGYAPGRYREYVRVVPRTETVVTVTDPAFAGERCRMTREYTTTIEIDGVPRGAFGTKCLTANGAWVLGRPKLAPDFD